MRRIQLLFTLLIVSLFLPYTKLMAQDTTWVQTFTFDSTWNRRAKFFFPTVNQDYRKILLYFDLKCYAALSGDNQYPCAQWDGVTTNSVFYHKGTADSTITSGYYFSVNGTNPDSIRYTTTAPYNLFKHYKYFNVITATNSLTTYQVGSATVQQSLPYNLPDTMQHSQFVWKASELTTAGLTAGMITGLQLQFADNNAIINNLVIRMRTVGNDSINSSAFTVDSLTTVFNYQQTITASGWNSVQFTTPYNWDGVSNILIDFSYENRGTQATNLILGTNTSYPSGIYTTGANYCTGNDMNNTGIIDFGLGMNMFSNKAPRTYEFWANLDTSGNVFSSGETYTNYASYTFGCDGGNKWHLATNGNTVNFVAANAQSVWKHYALTYDGGTVRMYQDGIFIASATPPLYTAAPSLYDFIVGGDHNSGDLQGHVSNLRIWDKAIPQDTIKAWMNKYVDATHPDYAHLKADYYMNEGSTDSVRDYSPLHQHPGQFYNNFWWKNVHAADLYFNTQTINWRPNVMFERGSYTSTLDSVLVTDTVYQAPVFVDMYENPGGLYVINDSSLTNPSLRTSRKIVWNSPWSYTYMNGVLVDSTPVMLATLLNNHTTTWYSNTVQYEIARYVTPYGINLSMGAGETYVYDVTDYYSLLQDTVDFTSGSRDELENVRFAFIKGNPPAEVVKLSRPWEIDLYNPKYSWLADDSVFKALNIPMTANTKQVRMRTIITGHGAETSNPGGAYPHCCEFWDNTQFLYSNNQTVASWSVFRDCGQQPLYPQGGTWNTAREGWCPGDIVYDHGFNLTPYISNGILNIDYGISPVPTNNPGMGNGAYVMTMHLVEYGTPGRVNDAEMYGIISPTNAFGSSRMNPICNNPQVVLRNSGSAALTTAIIKFSVSGGAEESYTWTGNLAFMDTTIVTLPISTPDFWDGDNSKVFMARVAGANNVADEYAVNDTIRSSFTLPDNYSMDKIVIAFKTNSTPSDNTLMVNDFSGNTILSLSNLTANHVYLDTLSLPMGCYYLTLTDADEDGLSFWANTAQGTGYLQLKKATGGAAIKTFNPDFGAQVYYPFTMGFPLKVQNANLDKNVTLYPNPNNGQFGIRIEGYTGLVNIELVNVLGQQFMTDAITCYGSAVNKDYNSLNLAKGIYFIKLTSTNNAQSVLKMIVE